MRSLLAEVLQRELELLQELRDTCRREQECLRRDDLDGIREVLPVKEQIIQELVRLEQHREDLHRQVAAEYRISPEVGVKGLLAVEALRDELGETVERLQVVLLELKEINETNTLLLRQSLAYARKMLSLLTLHLEQRCLRIDQSV